MPKRNTRKEGAGIAEPRNSDKHTARWWLFVFFAAGDSHTMARASSRARKQPQILIWISFFIVMFHNSKCHFRISSRFRGITQIVAPPDQEASLTWRDNSTLEHLKVNLEPSLHRSSHCLSARGLSAKKASSRVLFPLFKMVSHYRRDGYKWKFRGRAK